MLIANPDAKFQAYPDTLKNIMSVEKANESSAWLSQWSRLNHGSTPLHSLPDLATELGIADLLVKDESKRSGLGSFKALGAPIALVRLILREFPGQRFEPHGLLSGQYRSALADFTVISATDGNHGRALAAAAQSVGCRCVIVLHANVSVEREQAIATYGARSYGSAAITMSRWRTRQRLPGRTSGEWFPTPPMRVTRTSPRRDAGLRHYRSRDHRNRPGIHPCIPPGRRRRPGSGYRQLSLGASRRAATDVYCR